MRRVSHAAQIVAKASATRRVLVSASARLPVARDRAVQPQQVGIADLPERDAEVPARAARQDGEAAQRVSLPGQEELDLPGPLADTGPVLQQRAAEAEIDGGGLDRPRRAVRREQD